MTTSNGIRPYGLGKFDTMVDAFVYEQSLDGCDEELGDSESFGWFGKMYAIELTDEQRQNELTNEESNLIASSVGFIIDTNSQGFVGVQYFDEITQLEAKWAEIEAEYAEWDDEEDEDDDDNSCDQCVATMINGVFCHETGCINTSKVKVDGEWITPEDDDDGSDGSWL